MELLIATHNRHKLQELKPFFSPLNIHLHALDAIKQCPEIIEDGLTFHENAAKKVTTVLPYASTLVLGDDSGLEVFALEGAPGVHSARYSGTPVNHHRNIHKLLTTMEGVSDRRARFTCVMALYTPFRKKLTFFEGYCYGTIGHQCRGANGFGYDPVFCPDGQHNRSMAELTLDEKNKISHRGQALTKVLAHLATYLKT